MKKKLSSLFGLSSAPDADPLTVAADFEARGQWREAIDYLSALNRQQPNSDYERKLIDLRLRAFESTNWPPSSKPWPPAYRDVFAGETGIPEIALGDLNVTALASGVLEHGALLVRGLVPAERVALMRSDIDHAFEGLQNYREGGEGNAWFSLPDHLENNKLAGHRGLTAFKGGVWAGASPRGLFNILELYRELNLARLLTDYFGDTPCISVRKSVLRRVEPLKAQPDWHQDGSFMGPYVRSMNLWIALTDCGGDSDAPGLDMVPQRLDAIVPTGTHGARLDWSVGVDYVSQNFRDRPPVRPFFKAGDALFFDHMALHCTSYAPHLTRTRYAIECWFFAASLPGVKQIPMLL